MDERQTRFRLMPKSTVIRKRLLQGGISAIVAATVLSACKVERIDSKAAINVATAFYGHMRAADIQTALTLFSREFNDAVSSWPSVLSSVQSKFGSVVSAELQSATMASNGHEPCYILTYMVKRQSLESHEMLFVCRSGGKSEWTIEGEELTRDDTQSRIAGGKIPNMVGVHSP
jgi:hypothetical protein